MASPPSSLPISTPKSITTTTQPQQTTISNLAFRSFISRLSSSLRQSFSQRRPWYELVNRSNLSSPESLSGAASCFRKKNLNYFCVNYTILLTIILSFLTSVGSLMISAILVGLWYRFHPWSI